MLWQFYRIPFSIFEQIAIVECSDPQIVKLQIPFRLDIVVEIFKIILLFQAQNYPSLLFPFFKVISQRCITGKMTHFVIEIV
ncbi:hypothetical protein D1872_276390 [compost metagenome]